MTWGNAKVRAARERIVESDDELWADIYQLSQEIFLGFLKADRKGLIRSLKEISESTNTVYNAGLYYDDISISDVDNLGLDNTTSLTIRVTPEMIYQLTNRGFTHSKFKLLENSLQKITLLEAPRFLKLAYENNYDRDFLDDRFQELCLEVIRAARVYRIGGDASFLTFAWRRVKTYLNRREMHHSLHVDISQRDIGYLYKEAHCEKTDQPFADKSNQAARFPLIVEFGHKINESDRSFGNDETPVSTNTKKKLEYAVLNRLKKLPRMEQLVLFNEMSLLGSVIPRKQFEEAYKVSSVRYSQLKRKAINAIGITTTVDEHWQREFA